MSALSWFQQLSPEMQAALVQGGFGLAGGALTGMGEEGRQNSQNAANLEQERLRDLTSLYGADTQRNAAAVNAMKSPLSFQRERAGMAFLGDMMGNGGGGASQQVFAPPNIAPYQGKVGSGGLGNTAFGSTARQFLTPEAMSNAEVPFWQGMAALNPDINPNLGASGYGNAAGTAAAGNPSGQSPTAMIDAVRQKQGQKQDAERNAIYGALMPSGAQGGLGAGQGQQIPPGYHMHDGKLSKDGSGFWHKLAKIGGIVGGGIATAMTGGAASPLLAAAIGAGSGAAAGWGNGGGWKGTLTGGALGGLTAGMGGGASGGAPMSFTNAVKSLATNPSFLMNASGQYIGGPAGTALQLGSMAAPHGFTANQRALANMQKIAHSQIGGPLQGTGLDETMGDAGGAGLYPGAAKVTGSAQYAPMIQQILKQALGGGQQGPVPTYGGVPAGTSPNATGGLVETEAHKAESAAQMQQMIQRLMSLINGGGGQQQPQYFPAQNPVGGINYGGGGGAPFTPPFSLYPQVQR